MRRVNASFARNGFSLPGGGTRDPLLLQRYCWISPALVASTAPPQRWFSSLHLNGGGPLLMPSAVRRGGALVAPWQCHAPGVATAVVAQSRFRVAGNATKASGGKPNKSGGGSKNATDGKPAEDDPKATVWEAFMFMLPHLWPKGRADHKLRVLTSLSFVFGAKIFCIAVPFYFKGIVDALVKDAPGGAASVAAAARAAAEENGTAVAEVAAEEATKTFAVQLSMDVASATFGTGVFALVAAYGVTRLLATLTSELRTAVFARVSADAYTNINESIFLKLHAMELNYHLSRKTGGITKVLDRGSRAFSSMAWCTMFVIAPTGFEMSLVSLLLQQQVGSEFVTVALSAVVVYVVWTTKVTNWRAKFRDAYNEEETRTSSMVVDSLLNYETVKYFGNEGFEAKRLRTANEKMNSYVVRLDQSMSVLNLGQQGIFIAAATASIYLAATGVLAGTMTVGDLVLVDALLLQLYMPLSWLGIVYREMTTSTQNMQAMLGLLNRPSTMIDVPDAKPFEYGGGEIVLENACFKYGDKPVLNNVSLRIPAGSLVAFVGPSGTGKTTIFRLLFRFVPLDSGSIRIDGQEIGSVEMASLRKSLGVIPQDTVMFNDTVGFNIEYGKLGSSMDEIKAVAKKAAVHDAIMRFDGNYETMVGERGLKLSGGEKQRVAIARVLLQNPDIILADEATSALDTKTEAEVVRTLRDADVGSGDAPRKRTVVMIAHRLATVRSCDCIFVLNGVGELAESGSHDELLEHKGLYHQLWTQQQHQKHVKVAEAIGDSLAEDDPPSTPATP